MILDSKVGNIRSPRFDEEQVKCIVEAKGFAPWLTSRQEEALAHLLLKDCASNPELLDAMKRMLSEMVVYDEAEFHDLVDLTLTHLRDNCGFSDNDSTLFVSFSDGINADGAALPAKMIRTSQVFREVFPVHVPVVDENSESNACCREELVRRIGDDEEGRSQGPSATPDKVSPWHLTTNNFAQKNAPASCR